MKDKTKAMVQSTRLKLRFRKAQTEAMVVAITRPTLEPKVVVG